MTPPWAPPKSTPMVHCTSPTSTAGRVTPVRLRPTTAAYGHRYLRRQRPAEHLDFEDWCDRRSDKRQQHSSYRRFRLVVVDAGESGDRLPLRWRRGWYCPDLQL